MSPFDTLWLAVLPRLPAWEELGPQQRELLASEAPSQGRGEGSGVRALVERGLLAPDRSVAVAWRPLVVLVRALARHDVFGTPTTEVFTSYVREHLAVEARQAFTPDRHLRFFDTEAAAAGQVLRSGWVREFLALLDPAEFERTFGADPFHGANLMPTKAALASVQGLLRRLVEAQGPVPIRALEATFHQGSLALAQALGVLTAYLLAFAGLDDQGRVCVGLWPPLYARLAPPSPPARLERIEVQEAFGGPYLVEDMASLLVELTARPARVKRQNGDLFARAGQVLADLLGDVPAWATAALPVPWTSRLSMALSWSQRLGLARVEDRRGVEPALATTVSGAQWLALAPSARLRRVLDTVRSGGKEGPTGTDQPDGRFALLPVSPIDEAGRRGLTHLARETVAALAHIPSEGFVRASAFLEQARTVLAPLERLRSREVLTLLSDSYRYLVPTEEALATRWVSLLAATLLERLLPLGGLMLGRVRLEGGQDAAALRLTPVGRYLMGLAEDYEEQAAMAAGALVVQPNFDVVLMRPNASAEAALARFAGRRGRGVGHLFSFTRASITTAAVAGLTLAELKATLAAAGSNALPSNVERELAGWFSRVRRVAQERVHLLRCPDEATADALVARLGDAVERLGPTLLLVRDSAALKAHDKALQQGGIVLSPIEDRLPRRTPRARPWE